MLTNALTELHEIAQGLTIKAARIIHEDRWDEDKIYELPENATAQQTEQFERGLKGVNYNSGFGLQHLFGTVWFTDGTWAERREYDGAENWVRKQCPAIPRHLRANG